MHVFIRGKFAILFCLSQIFAFHFGIAPLPCRAWNAHVIAGAGASSDVDDILRSNEGQFDASIDCCTEIGVGQGKAEAHIVFLPDDFSRKKGLHLIAQSSTGGGGMSGIAGAGGSAGASLLFSPQSFALAEIRDRVDHVIISFHVRGTISATGDLARGSYSASVQLLDTTDENNPLLVASDAMTSTANGTVSEYLSLYLNAPLNPNPDSGGPFLGGFYDVKYDLQISANSPRPDSFAKSDFSGTMELYSFNFYDQNGQYVDGITVQDDAGGNYPVNVAIPEPTSLVLFALMSLPAATSIRRRRRF